MIKGMGRMILLVAVAACIASESTMVTVSARYLPTRSQDDRLERLRELLKDLLESQSYTEPRQNEGTELGSSSPGFPGPGRSIYKREVGPESTLDRQPGIKVRSSSRGLLSRN